MAEQKKKAGRLARAQAQAQAKAKNKKKGNFFKETWSELKKVHWPNKQTVVKYTLVVLVFVLIMGVLVWCVDKVFDFGISSLVDQETTSQVEDNAANNGENNGGTEENTENNTENN
ncbi:MAG: preprotein translocase subunit SecE [Bacillota bacterium]|jgi:preprotein translocase subunit SecE